MVGQKLLTMGKQANNHTQTWQKIASRSDMYLKKNREILGSRSWPDIWGKITTTTKNHEKNEKSQKKE